MAVSLRVSVTGSRGKSAVARMIWAGLCGCGLRAWARITGVVPHALGPDGCRIILRPSGAHVEEMRWWLKSLPPSADAVVMENSAVSLPLQKLCGLWLKPQVTVLTNLRPDHGQWGPSEPQVLDALTDAVPPGTILVVPGPLAGSKFFTARMASRGARLVGAEPLAGLSGFRAVNAGLALAACQALGVERSRAELAIRGCGDGLADFALLQVGAGQLAFAFSANDVTSTAGLFASTGWEAQETTVLYNHRSDRPDRLKMFEPWLRGPWKDVAVIGDRPLGSWRGKWQDVNDFDGLGELVARAGFVFGCGNAVRGLPLRFRLAIEEGRWAYGN